MGRFVGYDYQGIYLPRYFPPIKPGCERALRSWNKKGGSRIHHARPCDEWFYILIACHKIGAVVMPAPVILLSSDIEYRIMKGNANVLITNRANNAKVDEALRKSDTAFLRRRLLVDGEAPGWQNFDRAMSKALTRLDRADVDETLAGDSFIIYFTSGTTKYPKMEHHLCYYPLGHLRTAGLWHGLTD